MTRRARILAAIRTHGPLTSFDTAQLVGIDHRLATSHIAALRRLGRLERVAVLPHPGDRRGRREVLYEAR